MRVLAIATCVVLFGMSGQSEAQWSNVSPAKPPVGQTATQVSLPLTNMTADYINQNGAGNPIVGGTVTYAGVEPAPNGPGGYKYSINSGTITVNGGGSSVTFTKGTFTSNPALPSGSTFNIIWTVNLMMGGTITYVTPCVVK